MANQTPPAATDYSGVREYVGARYVPVFANPAEWDNTRGYEPLTIVLYQGNSYTSTQYVPTGVDITDTTYWLETGNWNAQVEAYRREVLAFDGRITDNASAIAKETEERTEADAQLQTDVAKAASAYVDPLNAEITNRENADTVLSARIQDLETLASKPLMLIFGDSWADFNGGFANWANRVCNAMHCDYISYGVGGSGFLNTNLKIQAQLDNANNLSNEDKARVRYIVVVGGINDMPASASDTQINNIRDAVSSVMTTISQAFPNAVSIYAPNICGYSLNASRQHNMFVMSRRLSARQAQYQNAPWNCASPILPYFWWGHADSEIFTSDNLHLGNTGVRAFSKAILESFGYGYTNQSGERMVAGSVQNGGNVYVKKEGDIIVWHSANMSYANVGTGTKKFTLPSWLTTAINVLYDDVQQATFKPLLTTGGTIVGWACFQNVTTFAMQVNSGGSGTIIIGE